MGEVTVFPADGRAFGDAGAGGALRDSGTPSAEMTLRRTLAFTASGRVNENTPQLDAVQAALDAAGVTGYYRYAAYIFHAPSRLYLTARGGHYEIHSVGNPGVKEFAGDFRTVLAVYLRCTMEAEG